jgi:uncharacterized protein YgiB involved in biofilm formation
MAGPFGSDAAGPCQPERMSIRPRKSSRHVTLVLLATLVACGQEERTLRRDVYASRDDCVADWGDAVKCEQPYGTGHGVGGGTYWYGPAYRSGQFGSNPSSETPGTVDSARPGSHAVATSHVSRGGFGASGAAHSSGGG